MSTLQTLLGLPKSLYINLRSMPLKDALKLPILVSHRTKFKSLKGRVTFTEPLHRGMLRIGFEGSGTSLFTPTVIENDGVIVCGDNVNIGGGCQVCTVGQGTLELGSGVYLMGECHVIARQNVSIGAGSFVSWDTQIMDTDFHAVTDQQGNQLNPDKPVHIANHVWVGSRVSILKGASLLPGTIVASGSTINKPVEQEGVVVTGLPVRVLKNNVDWY